MLNICRSAVFRFMLPLFIAVGASRPAAAVDLLCAGTGVVIAGGEERDRNVACDAVREGRVFLDSLGLPLNGNIRLVLTTALEHADYQNAAGIYDPRKREITMLGYTAAHENSRRCDSAFGRPFSIAIWRSYVIHELAHAAAQNNFAHWGIFTLASEYIASVAQMATLSSSLRERVLNHYPELEGFGKGDEISIGYYLLDPGRFTVNAYLHYLRPENGKEFIGRILKEGLQHE